MNAQRSNQRVVEKIDAVFSTCNEGLSKEERESRLQGLERIANSVRARRIRDPAYRVLSVSLILFALVVFAHSCLQIVSGSVIYDLAKCRQPTPILLMSCNIHRPTASSRLCPANPLDLVSQCEPPETASIARPTRAPARVSQRPWRRAANLGSAPYTERSPA